MKNESNIYLKLLWGERTDHNLCSRSLLHSIDEGAGPWKSPREYVKQTHPSLIAAEETLHLPGQTCPTWRGK